MKSRKIFENYRHMYLVYDKDVDEKLKICADRIHKIHHEHGKHYVLAIGEHSGVLFVQLMPKYNTFNSKDEDLFPEAVHKMLHEVVKDVDGEDWCIIFTELLSEELLMLFKDFIRSSVVEIIA